MTFYTRKFKLPFFSRGDIYSASKDRQRFEAIDSELSAISSLIGSGVVRGLEVTSNNVDTIFVGEGIFCLQGKMYFNSVSQDIYVDTAGVSYVWVKSGTSSSIIYGNISNISKIEYIDESAGEPVTHVDFDSVSPYSVIINISSELPADTKRIAIYKSSEDVFSSATQIGVISYPTISFRDEFVSPGGSYHYWFINEDLNGFVSEASDSFSYSSQSDMSVPDAPSGLRLYAAHRSLGVTWNLSISKNVSYYIVRCEQLGEVQEKISLSMSSSLVFTSLLNGSLCTVSIKAVSFSGIESDSVSSGLSPSFHPGARDSDTIFASFSPSSDEGQIRAAISVIWEDPFIDQGLSDLSIGEQKELSGKYDVITKYQVWEIRQNGAISIQGEPTIAFTPNEIIFSSFNKKNSQNIIVNEKLKDNAHYLVKLYRSIDGMDSVGRYAYVRTGDVTPPLPAFDILMETQGTGAIGVSWSIPSISEVSKQRVSVSSAPITSVTYDYTSTTEVLLKFQSNMISILYQGLFEDRPPIKIGYVDGYFVFEVDEARINFINSAGTVSGLVEGNVVEIEILSPPSGTYMGVSGLSLSEFKSNFLAMPPVFKCKWRPPGSLATSSFISIADLVEVINTTGIDDDDTYLNRLVSVAPYSFNFEGDVIKIRSLNEGISFDQIPKTVTLGDFRLEATEELSQNTTYIISSEYVFPGRRYIFTVELFDFANNISSASSSMHDTQELWAIAPPQAPTMQLISIEDSSVKVLWIPSFSDSISGYEVLRSNVDDSGAINSEAESRISWKLIARLPKGTHEYIDYSAIPGSYYIYRVVSIGILGKVSPSFFALNENNETTNIKQLTSIEAGSFVPSILLMKSGNDVTVNINNHDSSYDGYHIFRSFNMGNFDKIGTLKSGSPIFRDIGVLLKSGSYRYVIRPVTTQASIIVTTDENFSDGVLLAEIVSSISGVTILDRSTSALLASASVSPELDAKILSHRHLLISEDTDSRVDLSYSYEFINFETDNNQRFFISDAVPDLAPGYTVFVFLNDQLSQVSYEFNPVRRLLKFSARLSPIGSDERTVELFATLPSIKLVIGVGGETSGGLTSDRLSSIFAQQVGAGKLSNKLIPSLSHLGVSGEVMNPLDCTVESIDGFKHMVTINELRNFLTYNKMNNTTTEFSELEFNDTGMSDAESISKVGFPLNKTRHYIVYDAFNIPGTENFIFSTSRGVYYYWQNGAIFNMDLLVASEPPQDSGPCHKIVFLPESKVVICLNFRSFDILKISKNGGVAVIHAQQALDFNVHVFRDTTECSDGSVFITSDIGLFRIRTSNFANYQEGSGSQVGDVSNLKIEQLGLFSGTSTDTYATWTNDSKEILYVSTEFGVFSSSNFGATFTLNTNLIRTPALWNVLNYQGTWFAVSDHGIYRKRLDESSFVRIYYNELLSFRRLIVKYGKIIVVTSDGLYVTENIVNCKYSSSVLIRPINVDMSASGKRKTVYSAVAFGSYIVVCLEGKSKMMYNIDRYAEHVDFSGSITIYGDDDFPTVKINDKYVGIGVYFQYSQDGIKDDCIFFDKFVPEDSKVRVARQYGKFILNSGGWARRDFASPCMLYKNNTQLNDGSRANKPFNQIAYYTELVHKLTDHVSNIEDVETNLLSLRLHAVNMLTNKINEDGDPIEFGIHRFTRNNIRLLIDKIDEVNTKIYDNDDVANLGILSSLRLPYVNMEVNFVANVLPSPYGVNISMLAYLGINYESYDDIDFEGLLGTYDPEDPTYYLPNIPTRTRLDGVSAPNYEYDDSEAFSDDIDVPYSGYYGENSSPAALAGFGNPNGSNSGGGGEIDPGGGSIGDGSGGGLGGGGAL